MLVDTIYCVDLITQKIASEKMMNLNIEEMVFTVKIIIFNAKMFAKITIVVLVFEIDSGSIYIATTLIINYTTVLFQLIVLKS